MTYYWALVGKNPDHLSLDAIQQHHSCFFPLSVTWYELPFAYCSCCPGCRGKNLKKLFFHFNSIKVKKSDKKWKKVIKSEKEWLFEFGNPTDLNPSVLALEISFVINIPYMDPMGMDCLCSELCWFLGCFFRQVKHEEETAPIVLEGEPRSVALEPEKTTPNNFWLVVSTPLKNISQNGNLHINHHLDLVKYQTAATGC